MYVFIHCWESWSQLVGAQPEQQPWAGPMWIATCRITFSHKTITPYPTFGRVILPMFVLFVSIHPHKLFAFSWLLWSFSLWQLVEMTVARFFGGQTRQSTWTSVKHCASWQFLSTGVKYIVWHSMIVDYQANGYSSTNQHEPTTINHRSAHGFCTSSCTQLGDGPPDALRSFDPTMVGTWWQYSEACAGTGRGDLAFGSPVSILVPIVKMGLSPMIADDQP